MSQVEQAFTGDGGDTIVDPDDGNKAVEEYVYLDMYLTTDGAIQTLREISPSCLTATNPPANCDPSPRFIAPIEQDVTNPDHWVAGGRYVWDDTKAWDTVCRRAGLRLEAGLRHRRRPLHHRHGRERCSDLRRLVWALQPGRRGALHPRHRHQLRRRLASADDSAAAQPVHHLDRGGSRQRRPCLPSFGSYSRRWIPDAGVGHVFETTNGGASWTDVSRNLPDAPVYKVVIRGSQPDRRHRGRRLPQLAIFVGGRSFGEQVDTRVVVDAGIWAAAGHRMGSHHRAGRPHRGRHPRPRNLGAARASLRFSSTGSDTAPSSSDQRITSRARGVQSGH